MQKLLGYIGEFLRDILKVSNHFLRPEMPLSAFLVSRFDKEAQH